jgi:N-acylneuraminate cytidylyltransferase
MKTSVLAIIPARGGSKGVLRKNIRSVGGRPLIAYAIDAARGSRRLARVVVTTEDLEIADISRQLGCEVILRPAYLAADDTPMVPVIQHAFLEADRSACSLFSHGILLQPTCPLRTAADVDAALGLLLDSRDSLDSVLSVDLVSDYHPARMYVFDGDLLAPYAPEPPGRLRQNLPDVYHRNGAIYAFTRATLESGTLIGRRTRPYAMPRERSLNIDDEWDLLLADLYLTHRVSHDGTHS